MIEITDNEENKIYYKCGCGTKGFCMVKPQEEDAAIVIDVRCPNCGCSERMVLLQYSSEENKEKILKNLNNTEFAWSSVIENRIIEEKE